ncbi:contractile injection system protein, VgrG/Pvc8 family [Delftia sp. JD2]|uniref:contractile injection system protein, VgrG/Pvc8 family n=1 Tax=Delftia sp. JD2 TaxID=469553 RepID=UPI0020C8318F|nr:contractile injection system protein, VgrG/Pvc8 family [Delftia sp. JD2]
MAGHAQERLSHLPEPDRARHRRAGIGVYGHPLRKKRTRGYRSGDCCAQFNESDCDLVPRWMQHQGIYFFFEHASHGALPGDESIPLYPPEKAGAGDPQNIHARQLEQ